MFGKMTLTIGLLGGCIWCLALVARADSAQSANATEAFKPVASVDALMQGQLTFFKEIKKAMANKAMEDRGDEIEKAAEVLAELSNVNRFNNEKEDHRAWATELRDTALKLAHEAEEKDADEAKMTNLFKQIKATCGACHDEYQE